MLLWVHKMKLIRADRNSYPRMKMLYSEAFPAIERAPFWLLCRRAKQGRAEFWELMDSNIWVGMAYVVRYQDLAYLFYLAVDSKARGKGYGTRAIEALKKHYLGCRLFLALETLEREAENYEQRLKRHVFYEKCGLTDLHYHIKEASVVYAVMSTGGIVWPEEYKAMIDQYLGWPLRWLIDMSIIEKNQAHDLA